MSNDNRLKPSGSAIFMYFAIGVTLIVSAVCFALYYGKVFEPEFILWAGITCFTIMYHLGMRLVMGNVTKLFKINYRNPFFKEKPYEKGLYRFLRVKEWKRNALTYNPELYDLKERTLTQLAKTTVKSEIDHWINILISMTTLLFPILWGALWIFILTALLAALFDSQFIIIQRYNRPRILRMIERENRKKSKALTP